MTAAEFRTLHGDPATWTTADHETHENLAAIDAANLHPANVHLLTGTTRSGKTFPAPLTGNAA